MTQGHTERLESALAGRYKIERKLGEGGMASVYLAEDLKHRRKVALKILKPELAAVIGAERFLTEIQTTANLQHPHILPLFDSGEAGGYLYYVMPYVEGETLRDKLDREKQLGVEESVRIAREVADALDYAHRQGVIHRDIKPANILLHDGRPVVADFGIALAVSAAGGGRMTETGLSLGTPHYMSPEQASADRDLSARSDVYSLGCVLYEMIGGQPPHTGPSAQSILVHILTEEAKPLSKLRHTVPPHVAAAVSKSIEKLPADRFETAREFKDALENPAFTYEVGPRTAIHAGAASPSAPTSTQRNRGLMPVAGSLAAAFVFAVLAAWGWLRPAPIAAPQDVVRFPLVTPEDARLASGGGSADFAISPDGRQVAYMSPLQPGPQLNLWALSELSGAPLRGAEGGTGPFFSPDGQWVGFVDFRNTTAIQRVAVLGGAPVALVEAPSSIRGASWGRDGTIVFGTLNGGLFRVPEGGGEPEALTTLGEGESDHVWPDIIDGHDAVVFTIVVASGGQPLTEGTLAVLDLESGEITRLDVQGVSPRYVSTGHLVYAASDGSLRAVPFDVETLTVTGTTVPLLEGLLVKPSGAADFDISDGGRLIHTSGGEAGGTVTRSVLWVDRDGREEPLGITPQGYVYPRLSPDGRRLALDDRTNQTGLWIWDFGIETLTRLVLGEGDFMYQVWSPDGARLAYSDRSSEDIRWKASNNTGTPTTLFEGIRGAGSQQPEAYFFTPDGEHVVLRQQAIPGTADDLLMMPVDGGSEPVWQLRGDFNERNAELSPDGRWMAYESDESGQFEIYVRPFPDVESDQVQVSNAGGMKPLWSRDGRELFYLQPGSTTQLISVSVEPTVAGARFRPGGRQVVLDWPYLNDGNDGRTYDVSPDGQRFLAIGPTGGPEGADAIDMTVVLNWFTELRERMGN